MPNMWNTTITNKGLALQAKQVDGATIKFTRVVSGSGSVSVESLKEQTAVSVIAQTLSVEGIEILENTYTIKVMLSNKTLSSAYYLSQIGFYATDPDEGEILFAIAQIDESRKVPANADSPGYGIQYSFTFKNSNNATIEITPDMSGYMTREAVEKLVSAAIADITEAGADITE